MNGSTPFSAATRCPFSGSDHLLAQSHVVDASVTTPLPTEGVHNHSGPTTWFTFNGEIASTMRDCEPEWTGKSNPLSAPDRK
jgi:hypothetical protein